jgi:hypothetical protein
LPPRLGLELVSAAPESHALTTFAMLAMNQYPQDYIDAFRKGRELT